MVGFDFENITILEESMKHQLKLVVMALTLYASAATAESIAVITPYLAQPGTQAYVEGFEASAKEKGWDVNVIDTAGDVAAAISRIEDAVNQKVDHCRAGRK